MLSVDEVKQVQKLIKSGQSPETLETITKKRIDIAPVAKFEDLVGQATLEDIDKFRKKKKKKKKRKPEQEGGGNTAVSEGRSPVVLTKRNKTDNNTNPEDKA